jgi:hypothetical protein
MFKLSVLHLLDGIGRIQGALAATTTHELSNTPFTSNTPHVEGIQQIANFCEAKYETIHCTVASTKELIITDHREHFRWQSHPKFRLEHFVSLTTSDWA